MFCLFDLLDDQARALVEVSAGLGRLQAVRGSHEKLHAQPRFKLRDRLGHGGLAAAENDPASTTRTSISMAARGTMIAPAEMRSL